MRALALGLLLITACSGVHTADISSEGLHHRHYSYEVHTQSPWTFVSNDWLVESHEVRGQTVGAQKTTPDYVFPLALDVDGDGAEEPIRQSCYYDLRLEHRRNNGRIWLRTFPIPTSLEDKDLRVMVENYVENIANAGYYTAGISEGLVAVEERHFATQVLDTQTIGVSRREAAVVLFDVANVSQLQMTSDARTARAMVALIRTPYVYRSRVGTGTRSWPVLMLAGYANAPADFDAGIDDFRRFLQAIDLQQPADD